eukprot:scaffold350499_cov96-Attheya_sp.AAC.1
MELSWSTRGLAFSLSTRGLAFSLSTRGSTRTSITILSPCASRHPRDLRYYHNYHCSKYHQYQDQDPRHRPTSEQLHRTDATSSSKYRRLLDVLNRDTLGTWSTIANNIMVHARVSITMRIETS